MFGKKRKNQETAPEQGSPETEKSELDTSLEKNMQLIDALFKDVDINIKRPFQNNFNKELNYCIYYSDGVVDSTLINDFIIKPLLLSDEIRPGPGLLESVMNQFVLVNDLKKSGKLSDIISAITYGDTLLLIDGCNQGLILNSKSFSLRGITEPEGEKVLSGPREGFNEGIMSNLSLVRRRLRTNELKIKFKLIGRQSQTAVCLVYLDNIVNKQVLKQINKKLAQIDIDAILDSNYISENISEKSLLGFPSSGSTERPDVVVGKILEGRVAIFVDGTPVVLTAPYLMIENFQSNEDYYMHSYYASFARILRMAAFFVCVTVPAVYVAIAIYHHEILPSALMISITAERESVPLPAALEAFIMLVAFDLLRETGVRMPSHVGQALGIVGALIIGQAAVEAHLVASPMIIVVATTGLTSLLVPRLNAVTMIYRFILLILSANFGLLGVNAGLIILFIHMINLKSFGISQIDTMKNYSYQNIKDTFVRTPWPSMLTRTPALTNNTVRQRAASQKQDGGDANA